MSCEDTYKLRENGHPSIFIYICFNFESSTASSTEIQLLVKSMSVKMSKVVGVFVAVAVFAILAAPTGSQAAPAPPASSDISQMVMGSKAFVPEVRASLPVREANPRLGSLGCYW